MARAVVISGRANGAGGAVNPHNHTAAHTALCQAIRQYLDGVGAWHNKNAGSMYQRDGLPDFSCHIWEPGTRRPVSFYIEAKTGKGVLRQSQKDVRAEILQTGGIYIEARSVDDVHDRLFAEGLVLDLLLR